MKISRVLVRLIVFAAGFLFPLLYIATFTLIYDDREWPQGITWLWTIITCPGRPFSPLVPILGLNLPTSGTVLLAFIVEVFWGLVFYGAFELMKLLTNKEKKRTGTELL